MSSTCYLTEQNSFSQFFLGRTLLAWYDPVIRIKNCSNPFLTPRLCLPQIKPGSAEAQILSRPPRRIYAPVSASDNGLEGSPASKKRKVLVKEKERQLREEEETFRNEIASKGKKSKKDKKDKKRRPEENGHSKKKKRKGEVYTEEMDEAAGSKKSKKAKENGGMFPVNAAS